MKKILAVVLTLAMIVLLVACNNQGETDTTNNTTIETTNKETTTSPDVTEEVTTTEEETTTVNPADITYTIELTGTSFSPESNLYKIAYATVRGSDNSVSQGCILIEWNTDGDTAEFIDVYKDYVGTEFPIVGIGRGVLVNKSTDENGLVHLNTVHVKKVVIPSTVLEIREDAFGLMSQIETLELNEGLLKICKFAFEGLQNLKELNLPSTLKVIDNSAFFGCSSIKTLVIPESVTEIGDGAFLGCKSLETITIPERFKDRINLIFGVLPSNVVINYTSGN
ncbi:MAG: leucine-rich repeat domain-containing protein [Clostridiales bacterium]|nr:leucine-rich repeat domain-containing protein [Clostridiales bacterium]